MSDEIDSKLIGITASNGVKITGKSNHFIARTIGSVEQKRNSVSIEQSLDALLNPMEIQPATKQFNGSSQKLKGKDCFISINPDTGILVQVNPHRKG